MSVPDNVSARASVVVQRQVDWSDTDAAGHYHNSTVIRWVEAAEAVLLDRLELLHLYRAMPRVHYEVDYLCPLYFQEIVDVTIWIEAVGRTSVRYAFHVRRGEALAVRGTMVAVKSDPNVGGSEPWKDSERAALEHAAEG
jgi:acyl-CoA thioester hydrolase